MRKSKYTFPSITILLFIASVVSYSLTGPSLFNVLNEYSNYIFVLYYLIMIVSVYSLMNSYNVHIQKTKVFNKIFNLLVLFLALLIGASIWRISYYNRVEHTFFHIHISMVIEIVLFTIFTVLGLSTQLRVIRSAINKN